MTCIDELIPISEAARRLRSSRPGRRLHLSTILRWITTGCHGRKLLAWRVGRCWYTTEQALSDFFESNSDDDTTTVDGQRQREQQAALNQCDALGIK